MRQPESHDFLENNFNVSIPNGNENTGDERLFLKGGEGSVAKIKLFNGENIDDDDDTMNTFEDWKNKFVIVVSSSPSSPSIV